VNYRTREKMCYSEAYAVAFKVSVLVSLRPIGEGDQELEKRLDQKELT
jgi:hypothetical protein